MLAVAFAILFLLRIRFPRSQSLAQRITRRYGVDTLHQFRQLEKTVHRHKKTKLDTDFIQQCLNANVLPKFVSFETYSYKFGRSKAYKLCQRRILPYELKQKKNVVSRLHTAYKLLLSSFRQNVSILD